MNFGCEKFLLLNFLEIVGDGIGIPVYPRIKILKTQVTRNSVTQRIPRKCWINITEITMVGHILVSSS